MAAVDQAIALLREGNIAEAESLLRQILKANNRDFDALHMLGVICAQRSQFDEAEQLIGTALSIHKTVPPCYHNYGKVLCGLKRYDEAINAFNRALALAPNYAPAYLDRGNAQMELGRLPQALSSFERAIALEPRYAPAHYNRGNVLVKLNRYKDSLQSYDDALAINPQYFEAYCNRGIVLRNMRRFDEALASYEKALAIQPDFADAHFCESDLWLLIGDFARGWPKYEWRWNSTLFPSAARHFALPPWLGTEPLDGKTILLHSEQGLGDTIQFCRYVPLVAKRGARIILEVEKSLVGLMRNLSGVAEVIAKGEPLPSFELHCPLASLPLAFATRLETIPADVPYLSIPLPCSERWQRKLAQISGLRVGISWAGNPNFRNDHNRSIGLQSLSPLLSHPTAQFVSLQKDLRVGDLELLQNHPQVIHLGAEIGSFVDTAAIISMLDLVISSDTSVVHLAGALGSPIWTLLPHAPDWRWLLDRDDSPWYPTMRLFRQPVPGDWRSVIAAVRAALSVIDRRRLKD